MFSSTRITIFKIMLIIIGIVMIIFSIGDSLAIIKKDFGKVYDKSIDDYEIDELVTGKIEYVIDTVAQLESSQTVYGIPVKKEVTPYYLCLIPYNEATDTEGYFLIVHATDKESIKAMNKLISSTAVALEYGEENLVSKVEPAFMEFKTKTIPKEVMDYTIEYMSDGEMSESEIKSMMAEYMLEEMDYDSAKFLPVIGFAITIIPLLMFIISGRKNHAYKSSRTHYVNEGPADAYNTAPAGSNGSPAAMKRYSSNAYEAHTYPGGVPPQDAQQQPAGRRYDPSAYGGSDNYEPGEMDSIDTTNLKL